MRATRVTCNTTAPPRRWRHGVAYCYFSSMMMSNVSVTYCSVSNSRHATHVRCHQFRFWRCLWSRDEISSRTTSDIRCNNWERLLSFFSFFSSKWANILTPSWMHAADGEACSKHCLARLSCTTLKSWFCQYRGKWLKTLCKNNDEFHNGTMLLK